MKNRSREANNESTTLPGAPSSATASVTSPITSPSQWGALFLLSYYTDVAGVGAAAAGTMLLLVRVFDAFADVFAGRVVDSVNTRWGKIPPVFYSSVLRR
ncbi:MFS transporter [Escherichia coli]|nr:MFS transporter [Escherichia coli]